MHSSACIRQEWVYYAWGLVVLLVGLGYTAMPPLLLDVIFVFHYPLLFFMAGYFCSPNAEGTPRGIRSATRIAVILIAAYLALSLINALLLQALQALNWLDWDVKLADSLWGTLYGAVFANGLAHAESLWVLPVLATTTLIASLIERLASGDMLLLGSILSGFAAWGVAAAGVGVLPWGLHAVPLALCFYLLGRWLIARCYLRFSLRPMVANLVMYAFAGIVYLMADLGGRMSPQTGEYGLSVLYLLFGSLSGVLAAYFRAIAVLKLRPLAWVGQRWIPLIGLSYLPVRALSDPFTRLYEALSVSIWLQPFGAMLQALVALSLTSAVLLLLERVSPRFSDWLLSIRPTCPIFVKSEEAP